MRVSPALLEAMYDYRVKVSITDEDVERGHEQTRGACAMAYAIARTWPQTRWILVDQKEIRFTDVERRKRFCWETPQNIVDFINDFDRGIKTGRPDLNLRRLKWHKSQGARTASDLVTKHVAPTDANVLVEGPKSKLNVISAAATAKKKKIIRTKSLTERPLVDVA